MAPGAERRCRMNDTNESIEREDAGFAKEDDRDREINGLKLRIEELVESTIVGTKQMMDAYAKAASAKAEIRTHEETIEHQTQTIEAQRETIVALKERIEAVTSSKPDDLLQTIGDEVRRILDTEYFGGVKDETESLGGAE